MRPPDFWDSRPRDMDDTNRKPRNRKRKASNAPLPVGPAQTDAENDVEMKSQADPDNEIGSRKVPCTPNSRHSRARDDEELWGTSHTNKTAKPRASSPMREGTADSPIEVDDDKEDDPPVERNLFGPSKGSPLEESPRIDLQSRNGEPDNERSRSQSKASRSPSGRTTSEKENQPPKIVERPVTPTPDAAETPKASTQYLRTPDRRQNLQPMLTPSKLTPLRDSPWRSLFGMSPKIDSPSSATIKRLLSHINSISPTKTKGTASASASPLARRLPTVRNQSGEIDEDMFSTDIIMPSSPPAFGFSTDDNEVRMPSSMWTDILPSPKDMEQFALEILGGLDNVITTKKNNDNSGADLTVDFSTFIAETEKIVSSMNKERAQEEVPAHSNNAALELPAPPPQPEANT
jgi:hypothetical protein